MKYAITNGILLDGTKEMKPETGKTVLISDGIIEDIIAGAAPAGYEVIDLGGSYLMPGLINMHVHLAGNGGNGKPQKKQKDSARLVRLLTSTALSRAVIHSVVASFAKTELESGVTTIRTVGGIGSNDTKVRDEINSGRRIGPRILAADEGISVPGGHMAGSVAIAAESTEAALAYVDKAKAQGVDLIKLMITGGVLDAKEKGMPGELKMPPEMIRAVCEKAHALGFKVAAHTEGPAGVKAALENGVDSIEHGAKPDEETLPLFRKTGAFLVCTLSPALPFAFFDRALSGASEVAQFNGKVVFDGIEELSRACVEAGIPVALGNDVGCPWVTQYDFWRELCYYVKYVGVTPAFALYSATLGNATLAGIGDITGSVEKGKQADLIVTKENPLENPAALRNVTMVMRGKTYIKNPKVKRKAALDAELDKYL